MINRWGQNIHAGALVKVNHARGGHSFSTVKAVCILDDFARAYGRQVKFADDSSANIDDCALVATKRQLEVMAKHYVIACIWADCEEDTNPRATKQAHEFALRQCVRFVELIGPLFEQVTKHCPNYGSHQDCGSIEPACAAMGHDLYLTTAGHGAGFWDRDELGEFGDALTAFCKTMGEPYHSFYRGWLTLSGGVKA